MGTKRSINKSAKNVFIYSGDTTEQLKSNIHFLANNWIEFCILWKIQCGYPGMNFYSTCIIAHSDQRQLLKVSDSWSFDCDPFCGNLLEQTFAAF